MPKLITLRTFADERGSLTVAERILPFDIKRVFYIYAVNDAVRGGHMHKETIQAAICIKGSCTIVNNNGTEKQTIELDHPSKCLILYPEDWHQMLNFSNDAILLVLASTTYHASDYIYEPYSE